MHREERLSPAHEMYHKVLYSLDQRHDVARVRNLAERSGVNPGTVSSVPKKLERAALVRHDRHGTVALSTPGTTAVPCVASRCEAIKALLTEVLGLDADTAEFDAHAMEHVVSQAIMNRMERLVSHVRTRQINLDTFFEGARRSDADRCGEREAERMPHAEAQIKLGRRAGAGRFAGRSIH